MRALAALALLLALRADAAVTVTAALDPPRVAVGESSDLAVTVEGTQSASQPAIANTGGLSVSYVGPAKQMSIVNGRFSASVTHHFTIMGTKAGRYALGPITTEADGTPYDAGSVTLEVTAAAAAATTEGPAGDDLVLELTLPRSAVYLRERVPVSLKLAVGAVRVDGLQYPTLPADGVAIDKFPEPSQRREQTPRGVRQVVDFQTTLTPLKTGRLILGPAQMTMSLVVPSRRSRGFFDGFFDSERRQIQVQSNPLTLDVLPLPAEGRPADFSGAVGTFTFEVTAGPLDVGVGDPVTVRSVVRGEGSLDGLPPPAFPASDTLRVYPPQASAPAPGESGRTFEQVVIPLRDGPVTLPPLRFSYFDPTARAYRTIAPRPVALTVRPSARAKAEPEIVGGGAGPVPGVRSETLGKDLVFIKETPGRLRPLGFRWYRQAWWWAFQMLPPLLCFGATVHARRRRRLAGDVRFARFARADRAARAAFAEVRTALAADDVHRGHDAVAAALRDYLAAKLDLPPGTIDESAPLRLRASGLDPALAAHVALFFAACEGARFTPGGTSRAAVEQSLADAEAIVKTLERSRQLAPPGAAALALVVLATAALAAGEGPAALFFRANGLYANEQWAAAADGYEKVLAAGVESGAVHFNQGNAHYKAGDVGRAVVAYERALRLMPGDPDLRANLGFARELAGDPDPEAGLERIVVPFASRLAADTLGLAAAGAWWLAWLALAVAALAPAAARAARGACAAAAVAGTVAASSGLYGWWTLEHPTLAVVTGRETTVRAEPTPNATTLFTVKPGTVFRVERRRDDAALVEGRDGRRGWVDAAALGVV